jgi:hypothetical protein
MPTFAEVCQIIVSFEARICRHKSPSLVYVPPSANTPSLHCLLACSILRNVSAVEYVGLGWNGSVR